MSCWNWGTSEYLGVASSSAHRLLAMLQYRGFLRRDSRTKTYRPGTSLTTIASSIVQRFDVRQAMRPYLERVAAETGELVHLGTLDGPMVRYIDAIESSKGLRVAPRLGQLLPAHCTSTGKAMLAQLSTDELRSIYPAEDLEILTPRSISNRTALEAELARVARRGFAVTNEESEESVSAVAVALPADRTPTLLAVNVSMPSIRLNRDELRSIADTLSKTVAEAVEELF